MGSDGGGGGGDGGGDVAVSGAVCYLNGEYSSPDKTFVSVLDRGFLFGDGVYEVVPIYARRPLCWDEHIARLRASLAAIRLDFDPAGLWDIARRLVADCAAPDQSLYIQITRGAAAQRRHYPPAPADAAPTVFMMADARAAPAQVADGIGCIIREDFRWRRGDIKATALLAAVMLADEAQRLDVTETVLLRDGVVTEGFSSNVMVVEDDVVCAPRADSRILRGITYQLALECAAAVGYRVWEGDISAVRLYGADEVWISSSTRELLPVVALDGLPVGAGKPGAVFRAVHAALQSKIRALTAANGDLM